MLTAQRALPPGDSASLGARDPHQLGAAGTGERQAQVGYKRDVAAGMLG